MLASAQVEQTFSPPEPLQKLISEKVSVQQCWSTLQTIPECVVQILESYSRTQFLTIGPNCCKAIGGISKDCWGLMFPFDASFPPLLKNFCGIPDGDTVPPPSEAPIQYY
ncbi:hypothetical protein LguiA_018725 [Lonicera macranthoides]